VGADSLCGCVLYSWQCTVDSGPYATYNLHKHKHSSLYLYESPPLGDHRRVRHAGALAWRRGPACECTRIVCWYRRIFTYIHAYHRRG